MPANKRVDICSLSNGVCVCMCASVCVCCTNHASMFIINFIALIWINCDINDKQSDGQGQGARRRLPPRPTPVLNPLTSLPLSVALFLCTNDDAEVGVTFTSALIALIVSYLIGVGGAREQWQGLGEREGECKRGLPAVVIVCLMPEISNRQRRRRCRRTAGIILSGQSRVQLKAFQHTHRVTHTYVYTHIYAYKRTWISAMGIWGASVQGATVNGPGQGLGQDALPAISQQQSA